MNPLYMYNPDNGDNIDARPFAHVKLFPSARVLFMIALLSANDGRANKQHKFYMSYVLIQGIFSR